MNKKLLSLLLPVLGGMAIVGSGFSAWHFGEVTQEYEVTAGGNGTVTEVLQFQNAVLELNATQFNLTLDQDALKPATNAAQNVVDKYELEGVHVTDMEDKALTLSYTLTIKNNVVSYLMDTGYKGVDFSVAYDDTNAGIAKYVKVEVTNPTATLAVPAEGADYTATGEIEFSWVKGKKPTTIDQYRTMLNDLGVKDAETKDPSTASDFKFGLALTASLSTTEVTPEVAA